MSRPLHRLLERLAHAGGDAPLCQSLAHVPSPSGGGAAPPIRAYSTMAAPGPRAAAISAAARSRAAGGKRGARPLPRTPRAPPQTAAGAATRATPRLAAAAASSAPTATFLRRFSSRACPKAASGGAPSWTAQASSRRAKASARVSCGSASSQAYSKTQAQVSGRQRVVFRGIGASRGLRSRAGAGGAVLLLRWANARRMPTHPQFQILGTVVMADAVLVMDELVVAQEATDGLLYHKAMLKHIRRFLAVPRRMQWRPNAHITSWRNLSSVLPSVGIFSTPTPTSKIGTPFFAESIGISINGCPDPTGTRAVVLPLAVKNIGQKVPAAPLARGDIGPRPPVILRPPRRAPPLAVLVLAIARIVAVEQRTGDNLRRRDRSRTMHGRRSATVGAESLGGLAANEAAPALRALRSPWLAEACNVVTGLRTESIPSPVTEERTAMLAAEVLCANAPPVAEVVPPRPIRVLEKSTFLCCAHLRRLLSFLTPQKVSRVQS